VSREGSEAAPRCPLCSGTGRYWHVRPYEAGYSATCPRCRGTGRIEDERTYGAKNGG